MDFAPQKPQSKVAAAAFVLVTAAMVIAIAALAPAPAQADKLADTQAQASRIKAKLDHLSHQLDDLNERVQYETGRLDEANGRLARTRVELKSAVKSFSVAQQTLLNRLVTLYMNGSMNAEVLQIAKSGSFSNFVDKLDTIHSVSKTDARLIDQLQKAQTKIRKRKTQYKAALSLQKVLTKKIQKARDSMSQKANEQQRILNSVEADVRQLIQEKQAAQRAADLARARAQAQVNANANAKATAPPVSSETIFDTNLAPSSSGGDAASVALRYLGVPYVWGGSSPSGFDCSGLVMFAYAHVGVSLPHSSYAQWSSGRHVAKSELQRGDLVFFSGRGHVGIYLGGGSFVHAPHSGTVVQIDSMSGGWYTSSYDGAVRI